ncbi:RluA family pseudouridine synthase [Candidatus Puniceispirillum sp.]|nr:RluA family pseudouridine synthase [Candidatus Puniceispirillum sp.]
MIYSSDDQPTSHTVLAADDSPIDRIDRFLTVHLATPSRPLSRSRVKALILAGQLSEDGRTLTDPSASVKPGSHYLLTLPPPINAVPKAENIALDILFEDKHLLVLNKPAGLVVHPAPGSLTGTLVNALIAHCGPSLTGIGGVMRPGIVHRLDKDTSGTMIVAKTDVAHFRLVEMFATHDLDRRYQALVWGTNIKGGGIIDQPIGRASYDRKRQTVTTKGRDARTFWQILRQFPPFGSHIECRLETGRTHQIRVHLAHIGHGVIGDPLYGRAPRAAQMPDNFARNGLLQMRKFDRQALHAAYLGFSHPVTGEALSFETPLPTDMASLLALIESTVSARARGRTGLTS